MGFVKAPPWAETRRKDYKQSTLINGRTPSFEGASRVLGDQALFNIFISDLEGAVNSTLITHPDDSEFGGAAESQ